MGENYTSLPEENLQNLQNLKSQKNIFESQEIIKMDPEALKNLSGAQKEELMRNVQQQVALANMQELLTKITDKCFKKCISSPSSSLSGGDQKCLAMCMDRYMDSFNIVSRSYTQRISQEQGMQ